MNQKARRNILLIGLCGVLLMAAKCTPPGGTSPLAEVVWIDYEQTLNFDTYKFQKTFLADQRHVDEIHLVPDPYSAVRQWGPGVWVLYQICAVENDAPRAKDFHFDLSRFYVTFEGRKHHYNAERPLPLRVFADQQNNTFPDHAAEQISAVFKEETQTAPDWNVIPAGQVRSELPRSFRFALFVAYGESHLNELGSMELPLSYDHPDQTVILRRRPYEPADRTGSPPLAAAGLPDQCRPRTDEAP
jgi:hypothetical protein